MNEYTSLSQLYDRLMGENDYFAWADYFENLFKHFGAKPKSIIDLACGTGRLSCILADRGYEVIGVDFSAEMLSEAQKLSSSADYSVPPMFVNQDLRELDLYGTADAAICSFDGFNYIPPEELSEVFKRLSCFIEPKGLFIFDLNTEAKFKAMDGMTYLDEDDDFFCAWRTDYYEQEKYCVYGVDIFTRKGELWQRSCEEHIEYTPDINAIKELLDINGFEFLQIFGELNMDNPAEDESRVFICARRKHYTI